MARELVTTGVVERISGDTVRRRLRKAELRPWRWQEWLSPRVPCAADFAARLTMLCALYTGTLEPDEVVLCVDEKTSLQPRERCAPTTPARRHVPVRFEHEYKRAGALNLFAAFDTRTGKVTACAFAARPAGMTSARKCAVDFLRFLDQLDRLFAPHLRVHLVLDNLRVHKGRLAQAWFADHPRFVPHFPSVRCSWLNQVEQWFSILHRKLTRLANYPSTKALSIALLAFIDRWNAYAHPFKWRPASSFTSSNACSLGFAP